MIIGSLSGWLILLGRIALPTAISSLTNSGVILPVGVLAPNEFNAGGGELYV